MFYVELTHLACRCSCRSLQNENNWSFSNKKNNLHQQSSNHQKTLTLIITTSKVTCMTGCDLST